MKFKEWREFYLKVNGIDLLDLDAEWEKQIRWLYNKAFEEGIKCILTKNKLVKL